MSLKTMICIYSHNFSCFVLFFLLFYCTSRYCVFYKLKVCGKPALNESIITIFPKALADFMPLCHILIILVIFWTFHYYYICYHHLWLVNSDVKIVIVWSNMNCAQIRWLTQLIFCVFRLPVTVLAIPPTLSTSWSLPVP